MSEHFDWKEGQNVPGVVMNPGTVPVHGSHADVAFANMIKLLDDAGVMPYITDPKGHIHHAGTYEGRESFVVSINGPQGARECQVDMPGIPLDRVRYLGKESGYIFDFPRLYVDGSSWLWKYAISAVQGDLLEPHEDEEAADEE